MRIAYALSHPIQYQSPMIRYLVSRGLDLHVIYCTDSTARSYVDPGFGSVVEWDLELMEGYPHTVLMPGSVVPVGFRGLVRFRNLLRGAIRDIGADALWVHGWGNGYSLGGISLGGVVRGRVMLRGETHLGSLRGGGNLIRQFMHRCVLQRIFSRVSTFLAVGEANRQFYLAYGVPSERIFLVPYVVDNDRFAEMACKYSAETVREELGFRGKGPIVLFCGKLIDVKDPGTLIKAIGKVSGCEPLLLIVGDGHLRGELERLADCVAPGRVVFLGFKNQSELPKYYSLCDLFVLPSVYEPWGLVINEVMNAGKPVLASSCVGAVSDLIQVGVNGDIFTAGNVDELCSKLEDWLSNNSRLCVAGQASSRLISRWGFSQVHDGLSKAMKSLIGN